MARPMTFDAEEIVDKAVVIFWRQGFAATTPQNLVNELGIGKGSLYNTFKSKQHLFALAMRRYSSRRVTQLADGLEGPGPVLPRLRDVMQTLTGLGEHQLGCLLVNAVAELGNSDSAVAEIAKDLFDRIEAAFRTAIERGQVSGEIASRRSPADLASALLAVVIGTTVLVKTGADPDHLSRSFDALLTE